MFFRLRQYRGRDEPAAAHPDTVSGQPVFSASLPLVSQPPPAQPQTHSQMIHPDSAKQQSAAGCCRARTSASAAGRRQRAHAELQKPSDEAVPTDEAPRHNLP